MALPTSSELDVARELSTTYSNITSAATNTLRTGAGFLERVTVNKPVSASTITVYDNTAGSGTKIALITNSTVVTPYSLPYGVKFTTGLTIVTSGADDVTVVWRPLTIT